MNPSPSLSLELKSLFSRLRELLGWTSDDSWTSAGPTEEQVQLWVQLLERSNCKLILNRTKGSLYLKLRKYKPERRDFSLGRVSEELVEWLKEHGFLDSKAVSYTHLTLPTN